MKKQLLKLVVMLLICNVASAQQTATIKVANTAPVIDGDISEWSSISPVGISVARDNDEVVTYSATTDIEEISGSISAIWKAVWKDDAIYVLVEVPDDNFFSKTEAGGASHEADKPEIYFDVNPIKNDGLGASDEKGHYQIATDVEESADDDNVAFYFYGEEQEEATNYAVEYKLPFSMFEDADGNAWTPEVQETIGFDVTVIDRDEEGTSDGGATETTKRQRVSWSNDGSNYSNLDGAGEITFDLTIGINNSKIPNANILTTNLITTGKLKFTIDVVDIKIINTSGQVVGNSNDVSDLNSGIYIVTVKTIDGSTIANRFVK